MLIDRTLAGHAVLVAHKDAFQGNYLREVLMAAGATVAGPIHTVAAGLALIDAGEQLAALVVSHALQDDVGHTLVAAALPCGIVALVLHPPHIQIQPVTPAHGGLTTPYAGFQVVETLVTLMSRER